MSMLAEKKRREKWSLNPRGKAWSEDQNKFGQRLMEKMGWKTGQGLGANSQGQTDIVKARVKNDSKGLGFKENGEEWLKTTSDFDNLLDELASGQEDSGDGSQIEKPASLEDRSKKSRARVHYHKFTRGKDLSRYSEKDLASIIGPDVMKLKNGPESKRDYTLNQVNKGSLEDYFSEKIKSKDNKSANNIINGEMIDDFKDTVMNPKSGPRGLDDNSENFKIEPESEVTVSSKKKKRKKVITEENVAEINNSSDTGNCDVDYNQYNLETEVSVKKKNKKRKSGCVLENRTQEPEGSDPNDLNLASSGPLTKVKKEKKNVTEAGENESPTHDGTSRKRKRKIEDHSQDVENSVYLDNAKSQIESNADEEVVKKKRRKINGDETAQSECNDNYTASNSFIPETEVNEETVVKKKKRQSRDENKEHQEDTLDTLTECNEGSSTINPEAAEETVIKKKKKKSRDEKKEQQEDSVNIQTEYNEECSTSNPVVAEETLIDDEIVPKKKKSKDKNKEHLDLPLEVQTENNVKFINKNPVVSEETEVNDDRVSEKKKKKKKTKDENEEHQEEVLEEKQSIRKKKHKQEKEDKQLDDGSTGTGETAPQSEQVVSHNMPGKFLEVLGRRTRLKNIKPICKTATDDSYKTEDFMSFSKTNNSKKEATKVENSVPLNTEDLNEKRVYIYKESTLLDCRITKDVLSYENKLVTDKLSKLKIIKKPCIVITDSQNLNKSAVKKLEEVYRVRYYKEFLSEQDRAEIDAAVNKFRTNSEGAKSKDVNQSSAIAKPKPLKNKLERKGKTPVEKLGVSRNKSKFATGKYNNNTKLVTSKEVENTVNNKNANNLKCVSEANTDDCTLPKHVVAYEYRLVTARLKCLGITPPKVKPVLNNGPNKLNETTKRKTKQIEKIKHFKTLLPPNDLTEIEASVAKFYDRLKPKIEMMNTISEFEGKLLEIAQNSDEKSELKLNGEEIVKKSFLSKKEAMTDLLQKCVTLLEICRKNEDKYSTSEDTLKENSDAENAADQGESSCRWLKRVEDKLKTLEKHMKMLAKGKKPLGLNVTSQTTTQNKKQFQQSKSYVEKNKYQNTSYSRGRIAHNVSDTRGRGRGRGLGRSQSVAKSAVPSGGWGVLKSYRSVTEPGFGSQNFSGGCSDAGSFVGQGRYFSDGGGFMGRGRGFSDGGFFGRGRGFSGRGGFIGRGRGDLRGRGRGDMRGRGRISQNNFDAKMYAEKCKELNKLPVVCFSGVNMEVISGYPANGNVDKNASSHDDPKCPGIQSVVSGVIVTQESVAAVNTKKVPGGFSEVIVRKDDNTNLKIDLKKEGVSSDSFNKKKEPVMLR